MPAQHRSGATRDPRPLGEVVFLTVAEVASVMRVSKMTVYRLVHSGHLPAIRVGRSFRVPEQAVHEYLRDGFVEHIDLTDRSGPRYL
ncbi:helix-turn-helix domain-containing protein [Streptomyces sp. NPDC054855]